MSNTSRNILLEGISPIVYHFCTLSTMLQISDDDMFKLTETDVKNHRSDAKLNSFPTGEKDYNGDMKYKTYPYYMCFSRTPSTLVGYQLMRIRGTKNEWENSLVRIEIDGDLLNMNYKGAPVNYFTEEDPYDKSALGKKYNFGRNFDVYYIPKQGGTNIRKYQMPQVNLPHNQRGRTPIGKNGFPLARVNYEIIKRTRMSEYEDRIFSYRPFIKQASRYIKRIDIYVSKMSLKSSNVIASISKIIDRYGEKVYVYTNKVAFNSVNIRDSIKGKRLEALYGEKYNWKNFKEKYKNSFTSIYYNLREGDINQEISAYIAMIAFPIKFDNETFKDNVIYICNELGLNRWKTTEGVVDYTDDVLNGAFDFIRTKCERNFQSRFAAITLRIRNFEKRNSGKKNIMEMFEKLKDIAHKYCASFSEKYNDGKFIGIGTVMFRKYEMYLRDKGDWSMD